MGMNIFHLIQETDSRYPTPEEEQQILAWAQSIPKRLQIARAIEQKEQALTKYVIESMKAKYPNFARLHDQAWDKAFRDIQLVIRYNVQGMLLDDMDIASEKLLLWLRTILASFNMTPQFVRETYEFLKQAIAQQVPEAQELMEPHLNRTIEVLADFPEPVTPAV